MKAILRVLIGVCCTGLVCGAEEAAWTVLFDGRDVSSWKTYGAPDNAPVKWLVSERTLRWQQGCGSLVTREKFTDFELELEWKLAPGSNSGVLFRVDESEAKPWHTGPEVQLLDDAGHRDGKNPLTSAGALYALYPASSAAAQPIGEWNRLRLIVNSGRIECWLNDISVFETKIGSAEWDKRVSASKFAPYANFGRNKKGAIVLQDHFSPVEFRAIRIRQISK